MADLTTLANLKAWLNLGQITENATIPAAPGPYTVTVAKAAAWNGDAGVILSVSGVALVKVTGAPLTGQFAVAAGVYTFNAAQAGLAVSISYTTVMPADTLLARMITAVSRFVETWIGYPVASQSYALVLDGHGGDVLALGGKPPLTAVASLVIDGVAIPLAALVTDSGYRFSPSSVWVQGYLFTRGRGNIELACTRGWAATPADLEQAVIEVIAVRFKERDHIGQDSASMQGQNITFSTRDVPADVKRVLDSYKKVVPV
jgi:hypothetical protein